MGLFGKIREIKAGRMKTKGMQLSEEMRSLHILETYRLKQLAKEKMLSWESRARVKKELAKRTLAKRHATAQAKAKRHIIKTPAEKQAIQKKRTEKTAKVRGFFEGMARAGEGMLGPPPKKGKKQPPQPFVV